MRGRAYATLGDEESALDDYQRALEYRPKFARAHAFIGDVYYSRREFTLASTTYEAAKSNWRSSYGLGLVSYHEGNFDLAIQYFNEALEMSIDAGALPGGETEIKLFFLLGMAHKQAGDQQNAEKFLSQVCSASDIPEDFQEGACIELNQINDGPPPVTVLSLLPTVQLPLTPTLLPTLLPTTLCPFTEESNNRVHLPPSNLVGDIILPKPCDMEVPNNPNPVAVEGTAADVPDDTFLWLLVFAPDFKYYPQCNGAREGVCGANYSQGQWGVTAFFGRPDCQDRFLLVLVEANEAVNTSLTDTMLEWATTGNYKGLTTAEVLEMGVLELDSIEIETAGTLNCP